MFALRGEAIRKESGVSAIEVIILTDEFLATLNEIPVNTLRINGQLPRQLTA